MSVSQHSLSQRVATTVNGNGRLLATVMGLPLVDGLFPALILAGVFNTWTGLLQVGLLVFGGSATAVVIVAEFPDSFESHLPQVLLIGGGVTLLALIEAMLAPTFATLLDLAMFKRFAAVVLITIAAETADAKIGSWLPRPSITIALGIIASLQPSGADIVFLSDSLLVVRATLAVVIACGFAIGLLAIRPFLVDNIDLERFRFGSAVALCLVAGSILNIVPESVSLIVFGLSIVFAYTPETVESEEVNSSCSE